jgi:cell division protein FtsW (lipid II flippase)
MNKFMKNHDVFLKKALEGPVENLEWLLDYHSDKVRFLQHERLIHLMVTLFFSFILLILFGMSLLEPSNLYPVLFLILAVLLIFYILHYYKMENTLQRWYRIQQKLMRLKNKQNTSY